MERHTRSYLQLLKPGITLSNTLSGIAGFFLAASLVGFQWVALVGIVLGLAGVIASACVVNNVLDRNIDKRMKRTAKRDVANGTIPIRYALLYALLLGGIGFTALIFLTNALTVCLGIIAYLWYVGIYGFAKRTTAYSTVIGGVAGALPPVAGYTALTNQIDLAAVVLFLILFFWQLPHFYAIAIFRKDDYAKAKLPVWSVRYGMQSTKVQIFASVLFYAVAAALLALFGYTGAVYLVISSLLSAYWIYTGIRYYTTLDNVKWARKMFGVSLLVLLSMVLLIALGGYLP